MLSGFKNYTIIYYLVFDCELEAVILKFSIPRYFRQIREIKLPIVEE
jgi:hypothetical protein